MTAEEEQQLEEEVGRTVLAVSHGATLQVRYRD